MGNSQQSSRDKTWLSSWVSPGCKVPCATCFLCCLGSSDQGFNLVTGLLGPSESPGVSLISYTVEHTGIYPAGGKGCWEKLLTVKSRWQGRGSLRACYLGVLAETNHENGKALIPNGHFPRMRSPLRGHP